MTRTLTRAELAGFFEDVHFEAKAAQGRDRQGELPQDVWPSYSAMANTEGGQILLGVKEYPDGRFTVLGLGNPRKVRKALWDGLNNRQTVSANLLSDQDVEEIECEGKVLLLIAVPRAKRTQQPVFLGKSPLTGTYRRGFEGDYLCPSDVVRRMLAEAIEESRDGRLLPRFGIEDIDPGSFAAYRNVFRSTKPGHPWLALSDVELLRSLGGWKRDRESGDEGLTLAGLLMFGRLQAILEEVPNYLVDYQERPAGDPDRRWVDRLTTDGTWSGNLFDFSRRVYDRLTNDLKVPFRIEGGHHRRDETQVHEALREALVNALVHADYSGSVGILVLRRPDGFEFRNPGWLRVPLATAIEGGVSDCRNRALQKMFQLAGEGEQAGSGVPKILRAWREQSWRQPILQEEPQPECTKLWLPMISLLPAEALTRLEHQFGDRFADLDRIDLLAVATALLEGKVTNQRLQQITSEHPRDLTTRLADLIAGGFLVPSRSRRWSSYSLPPVEGGEAVPPLESLFDSDRPGVVTSNSEHKAASSEHKAASSEHKAASSEHKAASSEHKAASSELFGTGSEPDPASLAAPVRDHRRVPPAVMRATILALCRGRFMSLRALAGLLARGSDTLRVHYISRLVRDGQLDLRFPDRLNHPDQEYRTSEKRA